MKAEIMTPHDGRRKPVIVCVGEVLWDCFPDGKVLGGAPFNCAFMAHALGAEGVVISRVGCDAEGDEILEIISRAGLTRRFIQRDDTHPTGRVEVSVSDKGEPTFKILQGAWDFIAWDGAAGEVARECDAICFGTLAQRNETSRDAILRLLNAAERAVKVYDVNLRQRFYSKEILAQSMRLAEIVKLNGDELRTLQDMFPDEWRSGVEGFMREYDIDLLAVTMGGNGCVLYGRGEQADVPGIKVPGVDTVGSGDAFTAAMILAYLQGAPLQKIAEEANLLGAYVATQRGATPPIDGYREKMGRYLRPNAKA